MLEKGLGEVPKVLFKLRALTHKTPDSDSPNPPQQPARVWHVDSVIRPASQFRKPVIAKVVLSPDLGDCVCNL